MVPRRRAPRPCGTRRPVQGWPSRERGRRRAGGATATQAESRGGAIRSEPRSRTAASRSASGRRAPARRGRDRGRRRARRAAAGEPDGYFSGFVPGTLARRPLPLPPRRRRDASIPTPPRASSPRGRTGPRRSSIPSRFRWTDADWQRRRRSHGQVIYEMHVGTFTPRGHLARRRPSELPELDGPRRHAASR